MTPEESLLREINADLPSLDWVAGAQAYLAAVGETTYPLTKPFVELQPSSPPSVIEEAAALIHNFGNVFRTLRLPAGARVLDVACGGGWFSHWLGRMGYQAVGVDICEDLLAAAEQRCADDRHLTLKPRFHLCDLEQQPVPEDGFSGAVLESCLHHFYNPISALRHVANSLAEDGIVAILEGEARAGPIKEAYMAEMERYATIERPYTRDQLKKVLAFAGLPAFEFLAPVNIWRSRRDPALIDYVNSAATGMNHCIAAKSRDALRRVLPWWTASAP
jgi:SAM-dependent methyltransferase